MSDGLMERLSRGEILVLDGAMGTQLMEHGFQIGECPELLNLQRPEVVEQISQAYLEAGADVLSSNTFGGSPVALARYGLEDRCEEITAAGIRLARRVAGERALVMMSCGPCGGLLKPLGELDPGEVAAGFRRQLRGATQAGADAIGIETMIDLQEARIAVEAACEVAPDLPVLAAMTFENSPKGLRTIMGVSVAQAAEGLQQAGAQVIGSNCGSGIDLMLEVAEELARHSDLPLMIQANAGLPERRPEGLHYPEEPSFVAERVEALLAAGVVVIGGCCGTGPDHIRALRERISGLATW